MRKIALAAPCLALVLFACGGGGDGGEDTPSEPEPTATQAEVIDEPTATEAAATVVESVAVPQELVDLINGDIAEGNISGIETDQQFVPEECGSAGLASDDVCLRSDRTTVSETEATIAIQYAASDGLWEVDVERDDAAGAWRISGVATYQ
ncbi:MAG: hypothetical protein WBD55_10615 [Dehalococcoidia bacterium]